MGFDRHVRNLIRKIVNALNRCRIVFLPLHEHALEHCPRHYRLTDQPRSPTDWVTATVDTADNGVEEGWAIPTALHVVFARPHHLYWNSRSLCHMNCFHHKVRLRRSPTSEPSTQEGGMNLHILVGQAAGLG